MWKKAEWNDVNWQKKSSPNCMLQGRGRTSPLTARLQVASTALLALLRCEFWAVFTRLVSAVCVATLCNFAVTLKPSIWWRPAWLPGSNGFTCHYLKNINREGQRGRQTKIQEDMGRGREGKTKVNRATLYMDCNVYMVLLSNLKVFLFGVAQWRLVPLWWSYAGTHKVYSPIPITVLKIISTLFCMSES
jgi:hypothetical protein